MTGMNGLYRRALRRETHASRTTPAVIAAVAILIVSVAAAVGAVWWQVDARFRDIAGRWLGDVGVWVTEPATLIGLGAVSVAVATTAIVLALAPGRRARRTRTTPRLAIIVDEGVLADAVADAVAAREAIDRGQVSVRLSPSTARVRVTPTSGVPVDEQRVAVAAESALAELGFSARARVSLASRGVVA